MRDPRATDRPGDQLEAALTALACFQQQRALDGAGTDCLLNRARMEGSEPAGRRRAELVDWLVREAAVSRAFAGQVYDIAREEGIEPAFAMELVRCGVAVGVLDETAADAPTTDRWQPEWLSRPELRDTARRERRLRVSFRRLRSLLERHRTPEDALVAFVDEPDVDEYGY